MGPTRDKKRPCGVGGIMGIGLQRCGAQRMEYHSTGRMLKTVKVCVYITCMCRALVHQPGECFGSKVVMEENNNYRQITSNCEYGHVAGKVNSYPWRMIMRELPDRATSKQQQRQQCQNLWQTRAPRSWLEQSDADALQQQPSDGL